MFELESAAFTFGQRLPDQYCEPDISPPLNWSGVPQDADSLVLICHDPDAPLPEGWIHWIVHSIPVHTVGLAEGSEEHGDFANSWGTVGYRGPEPPKGHGDHHYFFHLYAVADTFDYQTLGDWPACVRALSGNTVGQARLVATYLR